MPFCVLLLTSETHRKKAAPDVLVSILPLCFSLHLPSSTCPAPHRALVKVFLRGSARLGLGDWPGCWGRAITWGCLGAGVSVPTRGSLPGAAARGGGKRWVLSVLTVGRMHPAKPWGGSVPSTPLPEFVR